MPPGTGDIQLTISQKAQLAGAVIVTTPQDIALLDARKGIEMFAKVRCPGSRRRREHGMHVCSECGHTESVFGADGGERIAAEYGVPLLASLPLSAAYPRADRRRRPTVLADPDSAAALAYFAAAARCARGHPRGRQRRARHFHHRRLRQSPMSIKSDKWIRRMAHEQGMIEPFEAGQVREGDGRRMISYGTSSYGYDVRCADEFRVFTNIHSATVDPKAFDDSSFVSVRGTCASSRRTPSPWRARSSTSAFRATC
jgi:hypothetical protein